ncbi:MAG: anti-sigma factor ChrR (cupin superfamily) [Gammaproteobacteria bacterium]|jgi:anti-sigma factor ChrR (cupin superfamily)
MKPVKDGERLIKNMYTDDFVPFVNSDGTTDGSVLQLDSNQPPGVGFHVYKMEPGQTTVPHEHQGNEEFLLIEGDITDNDGTVYKIGDLVWMKSGTEHCSTTRNGCLLAVYIPATEKPLPGEI